MQLTRPVQTAASQLISSVIRTAGGGNAGVTAIHADSFYHDGRGPELQRAHWSPQGTVLLAIEYFNPDDAYDEAHLKHVRFVKPQVVMVTPEEVIGDVLGDLPSQYRPAAMFDRGRSAWLSSFAQEHLSKCSHYQLLFYDELFDVIAEGVEVVPGAFAGGAG